MKYICLTDDYPGFTLGEVYEAEFEVHSTTIPNYNKFRTKDDQGHSRLPSFRDTHFQRFASTIQKVTFCISKN